MLTLDRFGGRAARWLLVSIGLACGTSGPAFAGDCTARQAAGYRVLHFEGDRPIAVWYPSALPERTAPYAASPGGPKGRIAPDAPPAACRRLPLILFSHGLGGCGLQSLFITEELARHGYVVAAPDHRDATLCSIETAGATSARGDSSIPPFHDPQRWSDQTRIDRLHDLRATIAAVKADGALAGVIDDARIGAIGHSLGGYAVLAMAGAWPAWKHPDLKAVVAMSPYVAPWLAADSLRQLGVAVMYQGAVFDWGITPSLEGANGAYALTAAPKYFVKLKGGTHFEWSNLICLGQADVVACLRARPNAYWIDRYAIEFLDQHLKGKASALLRSNGSGLDSYRFEGR